jgi:hypothetical protein
LSNQIIIKSYLVIKLNVFLHNDLNHMEIKSNVFLKNDMI